MKRLNVRRIRLHRAYSVEEIADVLRVHKNTVRNWLQDGLKTIDQRRPLLIMADELIRFIRARQQQRKMSCAPGEFYCLRCRAPRRPAFSKACYHPITRISGNVRAECEACAAAMWRRARWALVASKFPDIDVQLQQAEQRLRFTSEPTPNCNFNRVTEYADD